MRSHRVSERLVQQHFALINSTVRARELSREFSLFSQRAPVSSIDTFDRSRNLARRKTHKRIDRYSVGRDVSLWDRGGTFTSDGALREAFVGLCKLPPANAAGSRLRRIRLNVH
jgi:hypothetical protein